MICKKPDLRIEAEKEATETLNIHAEVESPSAASPVRMQKYIRNVISNGL
jgi:hypothetical protein